MHALAVYSSKSKAKQPEHLNSWDVTTEAGYESSSKLKASAFSQDPQNRLGTGKGAAV